jgi:flavin-dependent dehydrogenase
VYNILIIGAGSAGLTAAWEAEKHGVKTLILETVIMNG